VDIISGATYIAEQGYADYLVFCCSIHVLLFMSSVWSYFCDQNVHFGK